MIEVRCGHSGGLVEAGVERKLPFEFAAIAIGDCARRLDAEALGAEIELSGFLAPRNRRSTRLIVHVLDYRRAGRAP